MKTWIGIVLAVVVIGGSAYWVMNHKTEPSDSQNQTPSINEEQAQTNTTTTGSKHFTDTKEGVSFDIPTDWKQSAEAESGYPSFVSPTFSLNALKLQGAYVAYHLFSSPESYSGTPDEYLELMKGGLTTGWTETSLAGYKVLTRSDVRQQGSEAAPATGTYPRRWVIGRIGNRFIDITFSDATGNYNAVFETFLKSFKIN